MHLRIILRVFCNLDLSIPRGPFEPVSYTHLDVYKRQTQATKGRVVIDGVDFATLNDAERTRLRKNRIGFVFQKFNLLPTLSAMGNIETVSYTHLRNPST